MLTTTNSDSVSPFGTAPASRRRNMPWKNNRSELCLFLLLLVSTAPVRRSGGATFPARLPSSSTSPPAAGSSTSSSSSSTNPAATRGDLSTQSDPRGNAHNDSSEGNGAGGGGTSDDDGEGEEENPDEIESSSSDDEIVSMSPVPEMDKKQQQQKQEESEAAEERTSDEGAAPPTEQAEHPAQQQQPNGDADDDDVHSQPLQTLQKLQQMLDDTDYMTTSKAAAAAATQQQQEIRRRMTSPKSYQHGGTELPPRSMPLKAAAASEKSGRGDAAVQDKLWTSKDRSKYKKQQQRIRKALQQQQQQQQRNLSDKPRVGPSSADAPLASTEKATAKQQQQQRRYASPPIHHYLSSDDDVTDGGHDTDDDGLGYTLPNLPVYYSDTDEEDEEEDLDTPAGSRANSGAAAGAPGVGGPYPATQQQHPQQQQQQRNIHPTPPQEYTPVPPQYYYGHQQQGQTHPYRSYVPPEAYYHNQQQQPPPQSPHAYKYPYPHEASPYPHYPYPPPYGTQYATPNPYQQQQQRQQPQGPYGYSPWTSNPPQQQQQPRQQQVDYGTSPSAPPPRYGQQPGPVKTLPAPTTNEMKVTESSTAKGSAPAPSLTPPLTSSSGKAAVALTNLPSSNGGSAAAVPGTSSLPPSLVPQRQQHLPYTSYPQSMVPAFYHGMIEDQQSLAEAGSHLNFDSIQKISLMLVTASLACYAGVSPRTLPLELYNLAFYSNLRLALLAMIAPFVEVLSVFDARTNDINSFIHTFFVSFTVGYPLTFVLEVLVTTAVRLGVLRILEPNAFSLTPLVPAPILPWVLRDNQYRLKRITLFVMDFCSSCVVGPIIEEYIKLKILQWTVSLPRNFNWVTKVSIKQNKKKRRRVAEAIVRQSPLERDVVNANQYVTQMLAASLGLKLCDAGRRILLYTKPQHANKSFYAICRGIFPIHELCGTMSAIALAKRDLLGVRMPLWKMLGPAVIVHGMANFRGMKPIFKWNSATPWSEMQLSPLPDASTLPQLLSKGFAKLMWAVIISRVLGYCIKNYYMVNRQAIKRTTTYAGKHAAFSAELATAEALKQKK